LGRILRGVALALGLTALLTAVTAAPASASVNGALEPPAGIGPLSCAAKLCIGVGSNESEVAFSHDDGITWRWTHLPGTVPYANAVSCSTSQDCVVVGALKSPVRGAAWTTSDGGRSWQVRELPRDVLMLQGVSCPERAHCVATGNLGPRGKSQGTVILSTSNLTDWRETRFTDQSAGTDLSCSSGGTCVADGIGNLYSRDGGRHWRSNSEGRPLDAIDCVTASHCLGVVIDGSNLVADTVTDDGGRTWGAPTPQWTDPLMTNFTSLLMFQISCPTVVHCVGLGQNQVELSSDGGRTWSVVPFTAPNGLAFGAISCPSPSQCVAAGEHTSWVKKRPPMALGWTLDPMFVSSGSTSSISSFEDRPSYAPRCEPVAFTSSDGGASWTRRDADGGLPLSKKNC
jgi:photosystem II stability/assembly factor-like uncharacterized protein